MPQVVLRHATLPAEDCCIHWLRDNAQDRLQLAARTRQPRPPRAMDSTAQPVRTAIASCRSSASTNSPIPPRSDTNPVHLGGAALVALSLLFPFFFASLRALSLRSRGAAPLRGCV